MKRALATLTAVCAVLPGIEIALSGLGVPPGDERQLVFGGMIEAFGLATLLLLTMNQSRVRAWASKIVNRLTLASVSSVFLSLIVYLGVHRYCVVSQEPRGTVYIPLWTSEEVGEMVAVAGGRAEAIDAFGRYAVYEAVYRAGDFPIVITDAVLLGLYTLMFTSLTLAAGFQAAHLEAFRRRTSPHQNDTGDRCSPATV
jgi:hypothetical protein